jgi:hypothetical protein
VSPPSSAASSFVGALRLYPLVGVQFALLVFNPARVATIAAPKVPWAHSPKPHLLDLGVAVTVDGGRLHLEAPRGAVPPDLLAEVAAVKAELLAQLGPPRKAAWSGLRVAIEDLPAFDAKSGLRLVAVASPADAPWPVAVFAPEGTPPGLVEW